MRSALSPSGIKINCEDCGSLHFRLPQHCTLILQDGELNLVGTCPFTGEVIGRPVFGPMLPSILTLPVLLDPDVREHLNEAKEVRK